MADAGSGLAGDPSWISASVVVGGYRLDVGAPAGMSISIVPETPAQAAEQSRLSSALQESEQQGSGDGWVDEVEGFSERADDVTTQVERADKLCTEVIAGGLDVSAVNNGIDSLLALLQKLDRSDRFDEQLRLARSLSRLLAVTLRWIELLRSLRGLLEAAKRHGDRHAQAWALHEIGTLRLAGHDLVGADEALSQAGELRRALGDAQGLAATEHNLQVLCRTLRQLMRAGHLVRPQRVPEHSPRRSVVKRMLGHTTLLTIAIACLLLAGTGGVLAATLGGGALAKVPPAPARLVTRILGEGRITSQPAGIDCPTRCTARYRPSTPVTLTAIAGGRMSFAGWRGACSGRGACVVKAAGTKTVLATFVQEPIPPPSGAILTVRTDGSGSVRSNPAGIDCPSVCTATFRVGQRVVVTEVPAGGGAFKSWAGDCAGMGRCALIMDANHSVAADFSAPTLTVNVTGGGTVLSSPPGINCPVQRCSASFATGKTVKLVARADGAFISWTGDCAGKAACTVTMDANRTIGAEFSGASQPALNVTTTGAGSGTVTSGDGKIDCGSTCSASYARGSAVTLTETAASGSVFAGWLGAGCSGTGTTCTVTMAAGQVVSAMFSPAVPIEYTLTVGGTGSDIWAVTSRDGMIDCRQAPASSVASTCSATYTPGTQVLLTAAPGASFARWSSNCTAFESTCTVTMNSDQTVTATFNPPSPAYTLTLDNQVGSPAIVTSKDGKLDCGSTCSASYPAGTVVTLTASQMPDQLTVNWSSNCRPSGTSSCEVTMGASQTVTVARPVIVTAFLAVISSTDGTVTSSDGKIDCGSKCSATYRAPASATLAATPAPGWTFDGWAQNSCSSIGVNDTCIVTMGSSPPLIHKVQPIFAPPQLN